MSELINNSQKRIEILAGIIKKLQTDSDTSAVKKELANLVRETTSEEIVAMEQKLLADGLSVDELKKMCDLHAQVMSEVIAEPTEHPTTAGHPLHTFQQENEAIGKVAQEMRQLLADLSRGDLGSHLARLRELTEQLLEVEKHYARKENVLFSFLERHGITGPSQVMWGKDDDIRILLKSLREALTAKDARREEWLVIAEQIAEPMLEQVEEMIRKEERILLPLASQKLSPEEWGDVYRESPRFGFCLVEPGTAYVPSATGAETGPAGFSQPIPAGAGSLALEQLQGILAVLPVDLTFVDTDDRVAFFSEGPDRIFPRTAAIIGRKVQNCHPPQSVDVVDRILDDFRSGRQNVAEFWIELRGRFVHIRYFAVRDQDGDYMGTLEVTQDLTGPRRLTGERRLLQYEDSA